MDSPFQCLVQRNNDLLFLVAQFLDYLECLYLGFASKDLYRFCVEEEILRHNEYEINSNNHLCCGIWFYYTVTRIKAFLGFRARRMLLDLLKSCLGFYSYKHLFCSLRKMNFSPFDAAKWEYDMMTLSNEFPIPPLFSSIYLLRLVPHDLGQCRGGLYCLLTQIFISNTRAYLIRLSIHRVSCQLPAQIVDHGNDFPVLSQVPDCFLNIKATSTRGFSCTASHVRDKYILLMSDIGIILRSVADDSAASATPIHFQTISELGEFSSHISTQKSVSSIPTVLNGCLGLMHSFYGSHGSEILHISIHDRSVSSLALKDNGDIHFGNIQLMGMKVTGDPNVPAGNFSFVVNLDQSHSPVDELHADNRLVISFEGALGAHIVDMDQEVLRICHWYRGFGQINRNPFQWNPEWVGCNLLVYFVSEPTDYQFSILWDDDDSDYRHVMHFRRLNYTLPDAP